MLAAQPKFLGEGVPFLKFSRGGVAYLCTVYYTIYRSIYCDKHKIIRVVGQKGINAIFLKILETEKACFHLKLYKKSLICYKESNQSKVQKSFKIFCWLDSVSLSLLVLGNGF